MVFTSRKIHTTKNYHRFRQVPPSKFRSGSFRTVSFGKVKAVIGKPKGQQRMKVQSILFPRKSFTVSKARAWIRKN